MSESMPPVPDENYQPTPHVCQTCDHPLSVHDQNGVCTDRHPVGEYVALCACEEAEIDDWGDYYTERGAYLCENPPAAPSGFVLIECDHEPRHWPTYTVHDDWSYPAPCMYCAYELLDQAHAGCEHSHHSLWRRTRIARWAVRNLLSSGLMGGGYGIGWSRDCSGCLISLPRWRGKRDHFLWVKRDTWRCLLRGRHLPGDPIGFGYCSKCAPCSTCGSTTAGHRDGCEVED